MNPIENNTPKYAPEIEEILRRDGFVRRDKDGFVYDSFGRGVHISSVVWKNRSPR